MEIDELVGRAAHARQQGNLPEAGRLLEQARRAAPGDPLVLNALGMQELAAGNADAAARNFEAAVHADSREIGLWMNLASAHRARGDDAGEQLALEGALAIDQTYFMGQFRIAELHERNGRVASATSHWRAALALVPSDQQLPPALAQQLEQARSYLAAQSREVSDFLDTGLKAARAGFGAVETRRFDAAVDVVLGRRSRVFTNECSGLHVPFLPADEFFERSLFPWMDGLEDRWEAIRDEFLALHADPDTSIRPYVRQELGTPANKWTPLDNRLDWGAYFMWEYGVPNPSVLDRCPITAAALQALPRSEVPGRSPSAFFSLLKPHTRIPPHTGVTNTRCTVHLPLVVPPGCGFRVGGETRPWIPGQIFAFDDTIEHEAWNNSDELRVVLIFDMWNPHLSVAEQQLIGQFYALADASGHNPAGRA
ncbi:aspartyl/asparaginyl beta-hydroxylase domain-containing protein [Sandaracinobacteroides hominis]|uniref:aspartyl/asparaginyl beta-hydroxylase domain-containing protein n=1 Tax=Sandaracinobacteroides hominis TaxID=2780086 RepID=UPI0018F636F0|nr:aspartyl/asparaginyl beta-hydroxylase domain-containing protein [Sandaracinobacteroides hominis]